MPDIDRLSSEYQRTLPERITSRPAKDFFVHMLTRDIDLPDAILDLLDNCTDGVQRTLRKQQGDSYSLESIRYDGFFAEVTMKPGYFSIEDNCGGIAIQRARNSAFRLGRPPSSDDPDEQLYTIGTYGIGMKRAMFKMGRTCRVVSETEAEAFEVFIQPAWFETEEWEIPFEERTGTTGTPGTLVEVIDLVPAVSERFGDGAFVDLVHQRVSQLFGYIIEKGFVVKINGKQVSPSVANLRLSEKALHTGEGIAPYVYFGKDDSVDVSLAVGFYRPLLTEDEVEDENRGYKRYSREDSGWTVICNDRIVVYGDKTELTGWGVSRVPRFHNQFMAISGVVFFYSKHADELPLTTTKRGLDPGSPVWLRTRERMIEGTRFFTTYTNRWKSDVETSREQIERATAYDPRELIEEVKKGTSESDWKTVKSIGSAQRYIPRLPSPQRAAARGMRVIKFRRSSETIALVRDFLFEDETREAEPNEVGAAAFDYVAKRTRK